MCPEALSDSVHAQSIQEARDPVEVILDDNPVRTIWQISYLVRCYAHPFYSKVERRYGVSRLEYLSMHCLSTLGELRARQLVDILIRPKNTVSGAVHSLLKKGLIVRIPDPSDARSALLRLTHEGHMLLQKIRPIMEERQEKVLAPLTVSERRALDRILEKMIKRSTDWRDEPLFRGSTAGSVERSTG